MVYGSVVSGRLYCSSCVFLQLSDIAGITVTELVTALIVLVAGSPQ
jgi:hypothetical protein